MPAMLNFLDLFFIFFHLALTTFNLFGWAWKKTRKLNLIFLSLTAFSWLGLGYFYGIGYCPLTDWHWQVRRQLGYTDMPNSYVKFIIDQVFGLDVNAQVVDWGVGLSFAAAFVISLYLNFRTWRSFKS